jgi:hypothetical protein
MNLRRPPRRLASTSVQLGKGSQVPQSHSMTMPAPYPSGITPSIPGDGPQPV